MYRLARSAIFQLDPEYAHDLAIKFFRRFTGTPLEMFYRQNIPSRPVQVMGLHFKNPVGLAAGLDKNGECIDAFGAMGFGFIEVGTVTPKAQLGNDKPRIFRVLPAEGIINRMGFNNVGVDMLVENIKKAKYKGIIGVNIGKNKDTSLEKCKDDFIICMNKVYDYAGYIVVNISSPNTQGLRSLQYGEAFDDLLCALKLRQHELAKNRGKYVPVALKIAPDMTEKELVQVADALVRHKIDGVIATNTTLDRSIVAGMPHAHESGGLSGRPIQNRSTNIICRLHQELNDKLPIIGVGGVDSVIAAKEKMMAGAKLVQLYTGFIYHGPKLIKNIVRNI
ncbi:Dihydroorotate dehydrogenase [Candidatus Enterovibrio escicola]|uniref:Dihydroorotate dehydrogenase (quinone) n=2 Tax=Candidatus Enterovibrio escicola TaxID=1927127 RepID=A0A2A5T792_9GAMM|nr:Dihydroorotate dehydrogenase [Candidatus Enterovibrio escacola]